MGARYARQMETQRHAQVAKLAAAVGPVTDQDRAPAPDPYLREGETVQVFSWPPAAGGRMEIRDVPASEIRLS